MRDVIVYLWYIHSGRDEVDENYGPEFWDFDGPQYKGYPHYDAKVARKKAALGDEYIGSDDERITEPMEKTLPNLGDPRPQVETEPSRDSIATAKQWPVERIERTLLAKAQQVCPEFGAIYEACRPHKNPHQQHHNLVVLKRKHEELFRKVKSVENAERLAGLYTLVDDAGDCSRSQGRFMVGGMDRATQ